jgi:hypothetical protein
MSGIHSAYKSLDYGKECYFVKKMQFLWHLYSDFMVHADDRALRATLITRIQLLCQESVSYCRRIVWLLYINSLR